MNFYKAYQIGEFMDLFFTIDVEPDINTGKYKGVKEGIPWLLEFLNQEKIRATFFIVGETLEANKEIIKKIKKSGHEVGVHGHTHKRFDALSFKEKDEELKKSIYAHKKFLNSKPYGFRAPQHSIDEDTFVLLNKYGFKYDSSVCSGNIMLLRHLFKKNKKAAQILRVFLGRIGPHNQKGVKEISRPALLLALGGFELKVYPRWVIELIFKIHLALNITVNFVIHSWDLIDTPRSRTSKICSADEFKKRLSWFVKMAKNKAKFETIGQKNEGIRIN